MLDFTRVLAGPYATRILGDFGAEVIKVQPRSAAPGDRFERGYYSTWNRNKRGITLDLSKAPGVDLVKKLVRRCDILIENFSPRVMANFGLDYESLRAVNPLLIMVSLSAMGQTGPRRDYTGFSPTVEAFSGLSYLTSFPGRPPTGPGFAYADHVSGLVAVLALLGALEHRRRTGEGQYIDISETEALVSLLGGAVMEYAMTGSEPRPGGNRSPRAAPHDAYPCRGEDDWCAIAVCDEAQWTAFKRVLDSPAWAETEKFASLAARLRNNDELDALVSDWTRRHSAREVMTRLQAAGVPAGVVQKADDLVNDPQLRERGFLIPAADPQTGAAIADGSPIRLAESPARYSRPAPGPGQDNEYVYGELLGISPAEMTALRERGVI
ncbi:MAG: CoA transferase [Chloroflexi bacterium]|nr:CoA transferase [Chloroflexota bacterium]